MPETKQIEIINTQMEVGKYRMEGLLTSPGTIESLLSAITAIQDAKINEIITVVNQLTAGKTENK